LFPKQKFGLEMHYFVAFVREVPIRKKRSPAKDQAVNLQTLDLSSLF